jgi:hypothetical protein
MLDMIRRQNVLDDMNAALAALRNAIAAAVPDGQFAGIDTSDLVRLVSDLNMAIRKMEDA